VIAWNISIDAMCDLLSEDRVPYEAVSLTTPSSRKPNAAVSGARSASALPRSYAAYEIAHHAEA
jgi:hypothetical protein